MFSLVKENSIDFKKSYFIDNYVGFVQKWDEFIYTVVVNLETTTERLKIAADNKAGTEQIGNSNGKLFTAMFS